MRTLVSNSGRKSDANLRKLDASYRALVKRLATDPKDFYMGKELALIAHPGFLFPRAGLVLFPMPTNLKDSTFKAFQQMQRPVEYDRESGAIKVVSGAEEHIKYLDQAEQQQLSKKEFNTSRLTDRIYSILDKVSRSLDTSDINKSAFNTLIAETQEAAALATEAERFRAMEDQQAFYFTDLPGIRPIPTNWPQQFVLSMMETLGRHKDKLTGLGGGAFDATNFLVPSGINMGVGPVGKFSEKFETVGHFVSRLNELKALGRPALSRDGDDNEEAIAFLEDIKPRFRGIASTVLEADFGEGNADAQIQAVIDANAEADEANSVGALIARLVDVKPNLLMNSAFLGNQTIIAPKQYSEGPSIYQLLQEAFKLSELKYNYTPTKNDIRFMVVLVYYSLSQMNLHSDVSTVFDDIRETFERASDAFSTRFIERVNADLPALGDGVIDEEGLRAYLAHIVARELLNDEDEPEEEEEEVLANPHEPGHIDTPAITAGARTRMRNNLNDVIESMETEIRGTINEPIIEALHEAIIPEMVASLRAGRRYFRPLDEPGPDKADIISAVEQLFGEARIAVESHISNLNELCLAILTDEPIAAVEAATRAVRNSTIQITTIDDVSTSLDQLMTLGVDADNPPPQTEINYVAQMKEFMRLVGNELHFTHDVVNGIMSDFAEVDRLQTLFPSDLVSLLMDEYTAMRDIMSAFDDTTISYRRYLRGYAQRQGLTVDANLRLRRAGGGFAPDIDEVDRFALDMYRQDRARPRARRGPGILQGVELLQSRIFDLLTRNFPGLVDGSMYRAGITQTAGSQNILAMEKLYQTQTAENEIGYLLYNGFQSTDLDDSLLNYLKTLLNKMQPLGTRDDARRVLREELSVMADEVSVTLIKQLESIFGKGKAFSRSSLNYVGRQLGRVFNVGLDRGGHKVNECPHCNHLNPDHAATCRVCNLELPRKNQPSVRKVTSKLAVFDLDNTLFDLSRRERVARRQGLKPKSKKWFEFLNQNQYVLMDTAIPGTTNFVRGLSESGYTIAYLSGRPRSVLAATKKSLQQAGFPIDALQEDLIFLHGGNPSKQNLIKHKLNVLTHLKSKFDVDFFFDDTPEFREAAKSLFIPGVYPSIGAYTGNDNPRSNPMMSSASSTHAYEQPPLPNGVFDNIKKKIRDARSGRQPAPRSPPMPPMPPKPPMLPSPPPLDDSAYEVMTKELADAKRKETISELPDETRRKWAVGIDPSYPVGRDIYSVDGVREPWAQGAGDGIEHYIQRAIAVNALLEAGFTAKDADEMASAKFGRTGFAPDWLISLVETRHFLMQYYNGEDADEKINLAIYNSGLSVETFNKLYDDWSETFRYNPQG